MQLSGDIVKIIIVDDHQIFRTGLSLILNGINNFKVIAEAENGSRLLDVLRKQTPDIIFMDIQLPDINGVELTEKVKSRMPGVKIIALTMFGEIEYFNKMMEAGANGFLLKKAEQSELEKAITSVLDNQYYISKEFSNTSELYKNIGTPRLDIALTKREKEVLELICDGLSTSEIAEKLSLSNHTVEGHRKNLMLKTNSKNTASLVKFVFTNNII